MSILTKFLANLLKGKPVEPPTAPPPLNLEVTPYELPVPYSIEEMPRTFLHLLKISDEVSPQVRSYIETWLDDYDHRLVDYMHQRYGQGVDQLMDMITRQVMNQQSNHVASQAREAERDVLADLEKQLKEPGGDDGEARGNGTA